MMLVKEVSRNSSRATSPRKALNPLWVSANAAHDRGIGQAVEEPAEEAPVAGLGGAHVAPVRLDAGADDDVRPGVECGQQARGLLDGRREVGVGEEDVAPLAGQHGAGAGRPLCPG